MTVVTIIRPLILVPRLSCEGENSMRQKLTQNLIATYTKLDDQGRALLAGFIKAFPECSIEWLSKDQIRKLQEERSVSVVDPQIAVSAKNEKQNKQAAPVLMKQPRLF